MPWVPAALGGDHLLVWVPLSCLPTVPELLEGTGLVFSHLAVPVFKTHSINVAVSGPLTEAMDTPPFHVLIIYV